MGLLDQIAGQVLGSLGNTEQGGENPLLQIATTLLQGQGGLSGLLEKLNAGGLGQQAASWVSTGENLPVDGSQLASALGEGTLGDLAAKFGLDQSQVSGGLAQILPQLIDRATPNGTTEGADSLLDQGVSILGQLLNRG